MIRLLLVDDQALVRRGLRHLLELSGAIEVVAEASEGASALELLASGLSVDIALVDARMPGMDGLELIRRLRAEFPGVATLLLTTFDDDDIFFGALTAGAAGFLLKDAEPEELLAAIRAVVAGQLVLDDQMSSRLVDRLTSNPRSSGRSGGLVALLTERELAIANLVAAGASNREIADQLCVAEGTVKNHLTAVLRKTGLRDRTQLALAVQRGS